MQEPKKQNDLNLLWIPFRIRVDIVIANMEIRGFDPLVFETMRSLDRQKWLYGIGRTHNKEQRPVTWTLKSRHLVGKAVDIISKSRKWDYPEFYKALKEESHNMALKVLENEQCHIEWTGRKVRL